MQPEQMVGHILGHYRILRLLGYGGTATVFLAEDIHLQREVAIKVFSPGEGDTKDFLRRFAREARVLAQLDHPNILPVYDYGEQDGVAYLVMPRMAGGSLKDRLSVRGPLSAQEAVRLIGQILTALQYAHDRGLIHRDIKPGNMLFKADGTLLLSDFGLVKILAPEGQPLLQQDSTVTGTGHAIAGTPNYIAPEQIMGQASPASDIYGVGITLYEMLTGSRPFDADNYMGMLMKHLYEQPRPLRTLNPQISPALEAAVMHSLEKDPTKRYPRPADFLQALTQAIQATPTADTLLTIRKPEDSTIIPPGSGELTPPSPTLFQQSIPGGILIGGQPSSPGTPSSPIPFDGRQTPRTPYPPPNNQHTLSVSNPITAPPVQQFFPLSPGTAPAQKRPTAILIAVLVGIILLLTGSIGTVLLLPRLGRQTEPTGSTPTITGQTPIATVQTPKPSANGTVTKGSTTPTPGSSPSPIETVQPVVQPTTTCPAAGTARAAIMPPTTLGNDQNIIYIVNESSPNPKQGTVKRYDVTADIRTEINKTLNSSISEGQVSHDGQWVLFTINVSGQVELRLMRVDGQVLQTLYCAAPNAIISGTQWTLDQKLVVFNQQIGVNKPVTYLLDLTRGRIQTELIPQSNLTFIPRLWLDNTRVYMVGLIPNSEASPLNIYLLDTAKGANQHDSDLQPVISASPSCTAFDSSTDSTQLFVSICANGAGPGFGTPTGPSSITVQPVTGGAAQIIYTNSTQGVVTVRAISKTTLLLLVENQTGNTSQNGLWKVHTDGTGLTRLSTDTNNSQSLCPYTQYTWSNISRDGSMYALQAYDPKTNTYSTAFGSLNGGSPNWFTGISDGTQLYLVGWTNM